jgi:multiple sugar transport system substrate-binding protein
MSEQDRSIDRLIRTPLSRRKLLASGAAATVAAGLGAQAALGANRRPTISGVRTAQAEAEDFSGVTIHVWTTLTPAQLVKNAKATWEPRTGGTVEITELDFGDVPIKYAGVITTQDPSVDVLYTYAGFMGQFGDRIYDDISSLAGDTSAYLPATLEIMSPAGVLRALPVHSETEIFIYNKEMFEAAGVDPDNIPQTWDELYELSPKLTDGNRYPNVTPWIAPSGRKSILYWLVYYNSFPGAKFVSDDYLQVLFDNDQGLETWRAIDRGFKAGFFDPVGVSLENDYESGLVFNQGLSASQINYSELWGQAVSGNVEDFKATISPDVVGASVMPGVQADTHGGSNGYEGFGINRYSVQKDAAMSFIKEVAGFDVQKAMNLTKILPSSRIDVLNDPEVAEVYTLAPTLVEQGKYNSYFVNTPYVVQPVFADVTTKLWRGEITPDQAHEMAVTGVQDLIVEYLTT